MCGRILLDASCLVAAFGRWGPRLLTAVVRGTGVTVVVPKHAITPLQPLLYTDAAVQLATV